MNKNDGPTNGLVTLTNCKKWKSFNLAHRSSKRYVICKGSWSTHVDRMIGYFS